MDDHRTYAGMKPNLDQPTVGVDIGRVLLSAADPTGASDSSFLSGNDAVALRTPPTAGAIEALAALVDACDGRVWLVSKCGPRIAALSTRWLVHQGVHLRTGLATDHVRFCRDRAGKAPICAELGITHFVDDRVDVHRHLEGIVPFRFLFGWQKPGTVAPPGVTRVVDWAAALRALRGAGVPLG